ncbi:MAG: succinylglutamate desuccinylase/aspartoacylase family protein [Methanobacteriaceae archaeon]|nr:succinylglutamate desuccinylase/aspartoacylase family protein [Methanobacteriaceae archaeon]MDZ4170686.1 succinylglutamate desuccinylase/aspartoacylase family protein [Methanobacteriaceae archaeon]
MNLKTLIFLILTFSLISSGLIGISSPAYAAHIYKQTLDVEVGGNIHAHPLIEDYLDKNSLNSRFDFNLEKGSHIYHLGSGKGKKILICGGIHGDEVQGSLTVVSMLYYLKSQEYTGTIYLIPFAIPIDTEKNTRYYNQSGNVYDPNRKSDIPGTPVNKILKFAISHKISYLIDVHSGIGVKEEGMVYYGNSFEENWAKNIQNNTGCVIKTNPTNGTLRSEASKRNIKAITLEVEKINQGVDVPVQTELNILKKACVYLRVI